MDIVRSKKSKLSVELTPLIDVVFQLLVFFMLASTFAKPAIQMTLPKAKTEDAPVKESIVISLSKDKNLAINDVKVDQTNFIKELKKTLSENEQQSIHIRGDKSVPYGSFVKIVDLARQAGAIHVNLIHEEAE